MDEIKQKIIAKIEKDFVFKQTQEYIGLVQSASDTDQIKNILSALEEAYKNKDYIAPALPPIKKEIFEFEVPSKKVSIVALLKTMEKNLRPAVFNKYMKLRDGKLKLNPEDFGDNLSKLIKDTFKVSDCTAYECYYAFEVPAMQFGLSDSSKALIELISSEYTEYRFAKDTEAYNKECEKKEATNKVVEEDNLKETEWEKVAKRVLEDESLTEAFPVIKEWSLLDEDITEKMARLCCIRVDAKRHLLLDTDTLKYTFEARDKEEAIIYMGEQHQYINPLCIIKEKKEDKDGDLVWRNLSDAELYKRHLTIAQFTNYDLRSPHKYEITRDCKRIGVNQSGVTRADIEPVFYEECDKWIRLMATDKYDEVLSWIAHSLDFSVPLPVLSLIGPPNTGKSLLFLAIQEQIKDAEAPLTPTEYHESGFNGALLTNPFIVADDGGIEVNTRNRNLWLDRFKRYVTHSSWSVNPKYGGQTTLHGHIRSYCAFNMDKPHIRSLFHLKNEALGQRIFDVEVDKENLDEIIKLFQEYDVLGEKDLEDRWLNNGKLTKHVSWLIKNRIDYPVPTGTGRWGNMVDYQFTGAIAATQSQQLMLEFLVNSVADQQTYCRIIDYKKSKHIMFSLRTLVDAYKMISGDRKTSEKDFKEMLVSIGANNCVIRMEGKTVRGWVIPYAKFVEVTSEGDEDEADEV